MAAGRVLREAGRSILLAALLFACLGGGFLLHLRSLPPLQDEDRAVLRKFPPAGVADLKAQRDVLLTYGRSHPAAVLSSFCMLYVLMQTFAVPGTLSLSLLAGALFGVARGLPLVAAVSTVGASSCFALSRLIGRGLARALWPDRVEAFGKEVERRRGDMLSYIVFLRVTPVLPNTFINIASPVVGVPPLPFVAGTLLGCLPSNFVAVNAGSRLSELESLRDLYDLRALLLGVGFGALALVPVFLRRRAERNKTV